MENWRKLLLIIFFTIGGIFLGLYIFYRKWNCVNGVCTKKIGGVYDSELDCNKNCGGVKSQNVNVNTNYDCVQDKDFFVCKPNKDGQYPDKGSCEANCASPVKNIIVER